MGKRPKEVRLSSRFSGSMKKPIFVKAREIPIVNPLVLKKTYYFGDLQKTYLWSKPIKHK